MTRRYFLFFILFVLFVLALVGHASAETLNRQVRFSEEAAARGYTVESREKDFALGVRGGIYRGTGSVKIKEPASDELPAAPAGKKFVSPAYHYGVYLENVGITEKPLWISLEFASDTSLPKRVAFYNKIAQRWDEVPTTIDWTNNRARAALHFSFAMVAVLEPDGSGREPVLRASAAAAPEVDATAAIVVDSRTGKILYEKNADKEWWLASLTKLMTADVFLEQHPSLSDRITYETQDKTIGARLRNISVGESFTLKDAFYTTLVGSANDTAHMLGRGAGITTDAFLEHMNAQAQELGLVKTRFGDFSGLSLDNRSTVREYWKVVREAARSLDITKSSTAESYAFTTSAGIAHTIKNTNELLTTSSLDFVLGKTGYLDEAKNNFAGVVTDASGNEIVVVIFGSPTSAKRFKAANDLALWAQTNWTW
ncbi:MAG: D-alanyl-D-alanine carboxypeptidase [Candidatus Kerfeldbacteria bacterium]|nr:D-alanyl-D-alanine carboxypeptidase [Candidatus Kerfeldbacteria bacterium]